MSRIRRLLAHPDRGDVPGWVLIAVNVFLALVAATALVGIWTTDPSGAVLPGLDAGD